MNLTYPSQLLSVEMTTEDEQADMGMHTILLTLERSASMDGLLLLASVDCMQTSV
jgi:hypothetical protein